jgi:hypothetical protein
LIRRSFDKQPERAKVIRVMTAPAAEKPAAEPKQIRVRQIAPPAKSKERLINV